MEDHSKAQDAQLEEISAAPPNVPELQRKDKAAQFLKANGEDIVLTAEEDKYVLRKIDLRLLPLLLSIYAMQFLDKSTLSYASVFGLLDDTHLHGEDYSWLGAIVYIAQLVMQPVVALFLVKLPMGKVVTFITFGWGAVLCGMVAATNFRGLLAARFILGVFEAAIAPAFIAVVQMWYKRSEQTNRIGAWYATLGVVNMFGSLLTYGLGHIQSPLKVYQIIFLFCGCLTLGLCVAVFFLLPDTPMSAKFLSQHEKTVAIERLRANQMGVASGVWKWDHVFEALKDLKTWCWFSLMFSISVPSGGISTFGNLIVKTFVSDSFHVILLNMPFGAINVFATLGGAYLATKLRKKGPVIILLCLPSIAGAAMLMAFKHDASNRGVLLAAYYLVSFYPGISPLIYSWSGQNTAGDTKRKMTTAVLFIGGCAGNIVGPHLYTTGEAPGYHRGLISNLILFVVLIGLCVLTTLYLTFLNKRHAARRIAAGKSAQVWDRSMIDGQPDITEEQQEHVLGDKAFDDETDLRNEDFIYVY